MLNYSWVSSSFLKPKTLQWTSIWAYNHYLIESLKHSWQLVLVIFDLNLGQRIQNYTDVIISQKGLTKKKFELNFWEKWLQRHLVGKILLLQNSSGHSKSWREFIDSFIKFQSNSVRWPGFVIFWPSAPLVEISLLNPNVQWVCYPEISKSFSCLLFWKGNFSLMKFLI